MKEGQGGERKWIGSCSLGDDVNKNNTKLIGDDVNKNNTKLTTELKRNIRNAYTDKKYAEKITKKLFEKNFTPSEERVLSNIFFLSTGRFSTMGGIIISSGYYTGKVETAVGELEEQGYVEADMKEGENWREKDYVEVLPTKKMDRLLRRLGLFKEFRDWLIWYV